MNRLYNRTSNENKGKHHKDYTEFQKTFLSDTQKLFFYFSETRNPFEENRLVVLKTGDTMNSDVGTCLTNLLQRNEERCKKFYKHHLVIYHFPITGTYYLTISLLRYPYHWQTRFAWQCNHKKRKRTTTSYSVGKQRKAAKAATFSLPYRNQQVKRVFSDEVTNFPSTLTEASSMYHSSKSDLFKWFKRIPEVILEPSLEEKNTINAQKMKFSIKDFFSKCDQAAYLVTFTEEILNGKLHFLCSEWSQTYQ